MRKLLAIAAGLFSCLALSAQVNLDEEFFSLPENVTVEYLDSVKIQSVKPNDYWVVGVYGGVSVQYGYFNPLRIVKMQLQYPVYGFSFIRHYTMFGIFPNMGLEFGAQQNYEGYEFKTNKETGYRATESGAYKTMIKVPEVFFMTHFHIDMTDRFKVLAKVGLYGGYRQSIERVLDPVFENHAAYTQYINEFKSYDKRWTYGVLGGLGMGVMLDPFEFHLNVQVKWGWGSFWDPAYANADPSKPYYFRFAYPLDFAPTFGIYYQLSPRHGHTRAQLKKMAKEIVNPVVIQNENPDSQSR